MARRSRSRLPPLGSMAPSATIEAAVGAIDPVTLVRHLLGRRSESAFLAEAARGTVVLVPSGKKQRAAMPSLLGKVIAE